MAFKIPTELNDDLVLEFQSLVKKHLRKEVSLFRAKKEALRLITMYGLLIKVSPEYHFSQTDDLKK